MTPSIIITGFDLDNKVRYMLYDNQLFENLSKYFNLIA